MNRILMEWHYFKKDYFFHFWIALFVFMISGFGSFFLLQSFPDITNQLMEDIVKTFEEKGLDNSDSPFILSVGLFLNNSFASLLMFLNGFIPVLVLPYVYVAMNGSIVGIVFAFLSIQGEPVFDSFVRGVLPHGIFEIPALIYAASLGSYISITILKKLTNWKNEEISIKKEIRKTVVSFFIVVIPLLIIAAIIEGFITPLLLY